MFIIYWEVMKMITCGECGRINGKGSVGTSWICEDCKEGEGRVAPLTSENSQAKSSEGLSDRNGG